MIHILAPVYQTPDSRVDILLNSLCTDIKHWEKWKRMAFSQIDKHTQNFLKLHFLNNLIIQ